MSEPSDDELERARRIKQLRAGAAEPRGRRRRPQFPDDVEDLAADADVDTDVDHEGPVQPGEDHEMPDDAPPDLTVASTYLTEDLKDKTERIEEHLALRYEVEFESQVDGPRHVRPLALYLGLLQIEKLELDEIEALFEEVDVVESPTG